MFYKVLEFHKKIKNEIHHDLNISDNLLGQKLLHEEYHELIEAIQDRDHDNIPKEMIDLIYIICGIAISSNIDLEKVFDIVHESNMSKLDENGQPIYREDGKIMKGPNYKPPDLSKVRKTCLLKQPE